MNECLVVFSGGQDSTTCLLWAKNHFSKVEAITFSYGQTHSIEILQSQKICKKLEIPQTMMEFSLETVASSSALLDPHVEIQKLSTGLNTIVPGRNTLLLTYSAIYAQKQNIKTLVTGVCQTDDSNYPDCRDVFIKSLEKTLQLGLEYPLEIQTPLMHLNKCEIFKLAQKEKGLELVLEDSHTCYKGQRDKRHPWGYGCEVCPACVLRQKGWKDFKTL